MKTLGIVGGIAPESTIDYYRQLIAGGLRSILINSIDIDRLLGLAANDLDTLGDWLVEEVARLERAGADIGLLAANTPHIVFDDVRKRSSLPLISIVEAARDEALSRGMKRVAILGTRFTMLGRFYRDVFRAAGIEIVPPDADDLAFIHDTYVNELVKAVFQPAKRERVLQIVEKMKPIDGVLLAGTELPLLLRTDLHDGVPLLDTTRIHVSAAIRAAR
jgi:aspartate racemase